MRALAACAGLAIAAAVHAMVVDPVDGTFGVAIVEMPQARVHRIVARDGRVAMLVSSTQGGCTSAALMVLTSGGVPDVTFGEGGTAAAARIGLPACIDPRTLGATAANGAFFVAAGDGTPGVRLWRVSSSGSRDATFGTVTLPAVDTMRQPVIEALADGTIAIGGTATLRDGFGVPYTALAVVHLHPDGTPDTSFGSGGVASAVPANRPIYDHDGGGMVHNADGSVLVAGSIFEDDAGAKIYSDAAVARFDARGRLDTTYGDAGFAIPLRDASTLATTMAARNGEVYLAGVQSRDVPYAFVVKIKANGQPDLAWGAAAVAGTDRFRDSGSDPLVAVDGEARTSLSWTSASGYRQVTRYRSDGSLDASFGLEGHAFVAASDWRFDDAGTFPDPLWIASGATRGDDPARTAVAVARLLPDGGHRGDVTGGTAVIYYNPTLDHFFLTANPAEQALLDKGVTAGWQRTGQSFRVVTNTNAIAELSPVCRYYGRPEAHLDSHFFSAAPDECAAVATLFAASWLLETGAAFYVHPADRTTGACPRGSERVYRAFNGRADANHYYGVIAAAPAGWTYEGYGTGLPPTAFCAPLL